MSTTTTWVFNLADQSNTLKEGDPHKEAFPATASSTPTPVAQVLPWSTPTPTKMDPKVQTIAEDLLKQVRDNNVVHVERLLSGGGPSSWKEAILAEFTMDSPVLGKLLPTHPLIPKLVSCEITHLSPFHLAAMLGNTDVLVNFLDKDVPVDVSLASGVTALHLASFAGNLRTATMLIDIYKASINLTDKYGWTALHFASTEGYIEIVKLLVSNGGDISLRDKDGTSPAFRAQVNGHQHLLTYFGQLASEYDLLKVPEEEINNNEAPPSIPAPVPPGAPPGGGAPGGSGGGGAPSGTGVSQLYTEVKKTKGGKVQLEDYVPPPTAPGPGNPGANTGVSANNSTGQGLDDTVPPNPILRSSSLPSTPQQAARPYSGYMEPVSTLIRPREKSMTLPTRGKQMDKEVQKMKIRRLIRQEIEVAFSDYEMPDGGAPVGAGNRTSLDATCGVGINTMKGLMREELDRFRREQITSPYASPSGGTVPAKQRTPVPDTWKAGTHIEEVYEEEDAYATLDDLPPAPETPTGQNFGGSPRPKSQAPAPPLPPRNMNLPPPSEAQKHQPPPRSPEELNEMNKANMYSAPSKYSPVTLQHGETSAALTESIRKLAPILGKNWKKLAKSLPLEASPSKVDQRIKAIEQKHKGQLDMQAAAALQEWRKNKGKDADVDGLIIALRKCGLHDVIDTVERVTQEFTA